jgi:uncharacterized protein YciI
MKYFAAFLIMKDPERSRDLRQEHVDFLDRTEMEGKIFARGRFADGAGGLIIYKADSFEDAERIARGDPYLISGARSLELHEWDMKVAKQS